MSADDAANNVDAATGAVLLDARGLKCPLPVLKARRQIAAIGVGERLAVLADDPAASLDFTHFCEVGGHAMIEQTELDSGVLRFVIRKGAAQEG